MRLYTINVEYFKNDTGKVCRLVYTTQHEDDYKYRLIQMLTDKSLFIGSITIEDEEI